MIKQSDLEIYKSERTGLSFYTRVGTSDLKTIKEVVDGNAYQKRYFQILPGEKWIDLGGNIGAFTVLASSLGANVDVYEPDDVHCELIKMNLELNKLTANVFNMAVVHDDAEETFLNIGKNGNTWRNSIIKRWGAGRKIVKCINFKKVITKDICLKMDIDGSEMPILESMIDFPKKMVFEWSFDVDTDIDRYRKNVLNLSNKYEFVKHAKYKDDIKTWPTSWFPACTNVFCY